MEHQHSPIGMEQIRPPDPQRGVSLVEIPPDQWHRFKWPGYQRTPNLARVNQIAAGLRDGYDPGPVTLYEHNNHLVIVDGGHRIKAYFKNLDIFGIQRPVLALLYQEGAIEQNLTFIHENTKLRMRPLNIIKADDRSLCCLRLRDMGMPGGVFHGYGPIDEYPIAPLTLLKAGLILNARGDELAINSLAYLSVARAVRAFDALLKEADGDMAWQVLEQFVRYELDLWGHEGRHLLNFGVLGFAYFLAKNAPLFFTGKGLVIKTQRTHVSQKRGSRLIEAIDRSDYGKLASLESRWQKPGDQLSINASRDPVRIALELNAHFWKNRRRAVKVWRPEDTW